MDPLEPVDVFAFAARMAEDAPRGRELALRLLEAAGTSPIPKELLEADRGALTLERLEALYADGWLAGADAMRDAHAYLFVEPTDDEERTLHLWSLVHGFTSIAFPDDL